MKDELLKLCAIDDYTVTNTSNNLSAPVTINVNARGSDAEQIGETIYNTAERYLLRTLRSSFQF